MIAIFPNDNQGFDENFQSSFSGNSSWDLTSAERTEI